jgi:hypothetical protein
MANFFWWLNLSRKRPLTDYAATALQGFGLEIIILPVLHWKLLDFYSLQK